LEAQNAESKADFIHKIKIAAKEADESHTGLLYVSSQMVSPVYCREMLLQNYQLLALQRKILISYFFSFFIF
jgi:four helix bundle protein